MAETEFQALMEDAAQFITRPQGMLHFDGCPHNSLLRLCCTLHQVIAVSLSAPPPPKTKTLPPHCVCICVEADLPKRKQNEGKKCFFFQLLGLGKLLTERSETVFFDIDT